MRVLVFLLSVVCAVGSQLNVAQCQDLLPNYTLTSTVLSGPQGQPAGFPYFYVPINTAKCDLTVGFGGQAQVEGLKATFNSLECLHFPWVTDVPRLIVATPYLNGAQSGPEEFIFSYGTRDCHAHIIDYSFSRASPADEVRLWFYTNAADYIAIEIDDVAPSMQFTTIAISDFNVVGTCEPWQNPINRFDVNEDGQVKAQDALIIINYISTSSGQLPPCNNHPQLYRLDVNGDGQATAADALAVINRL